MYKIHEDPRPACHDCTYGKCRKYSHVFWEQGQKEVRTKNFNELLQNISNRTNKVAKDSGENLGQ